MTKHTNVSLEYKNAPEGILNELKAAFGAHHEEVKQLSERLEKFESWSLDLQKKMNRPISTFKQTGGDLEAERKAIGGYIAAGNEAELKAYTTDSDPQAGYLTMPARSETIMKRLFDQTPMRRLSRVITLDAAGSWEEPFDPSDIGATWVGETDERPETASGNVGLLTIPLHEIYCEQRVTQKLLDTSYVNIGEWIDGKVADKFVRSEGVSFVTGNGIKKPRGFLDHNVVSTEDASRAWGDLQYVPSGHATEVIADGLKDLFWKLKAGYRSNASWLMSSATANSIDKLKDAAGNYLWRDGMTAGAPPSLLGRPVEFDENMPAIGAGSLPIAFGNFQAGYTVVDRLGMRPLRDPYTAKPNVVFYTYKRVGGGLSNSEAIKLLKVSAA